MERNILLLLPVRNRSRNLDAANCQLEINLEFHVEKKNKNQCSLTWPSEWMIRRAQSSTDKYWCSQECSYLWVSQGAGSVQSLADARPACSWQRLPCWVVLAKAGRRGESELLTAPAATAPPRMVFYTRRLKLTFPFNFFHNNFWKNKFLKMWIYESANTLGTYCPNIKTDTHFINALISHWLGLFPGCT